MSETCWYGDDPHPFEEEPQGPAECYECGAPEEELSIYNSLTGYAWCSRECREKSKTRADNG